MFARKNTWMLRLIHNGKTVHELPLAEMKDGFTLGRGSACDWKFPTEDRLVSTKHAAIECKRGQWALVDTGSKNGIYADGQRVERCALTPGVLINIGQCELRVVDQEAKKGGESVARVAQTECHRLEPLNRPPGVEFFVRQKPLKGKDWIDVTEKEFRVGSDPSCELCIQDPHVSRIHAVFSQNEHGFFLTPRETTNPTNVNRERALPGVKQLMQDGGIVSIACYDFRFLDKHVKHTRSYLWLKIAAVMVTVGMLCACYGIYQSIKPSTAQLIHRAGILASEERFPEAKAALEEATHARGAVKYQQRRGELMDQLTVWEQTSTNWQNVRESLKNRRWSDAVRRLSLMRVERMENWNWNDKSALAARQQALTIKEALDVFVTAQALMNAADRKTDNVIATRDRLTGLLEGGMLDGEPLFESFLEDAAQTRDKLSADLEQHLRYERALAQLDSQNANFDVLIVELTDLSTNATEWVSRRVLGVLDPVRKLQVVSAGLRKNMRAVHELTFTNVVKTLPWPTPDECSVHPNLGVQRTHLEKSNNAILESARQVEHLMSTFQRMGINPPQMPSVIQQATDRVRWDGVFACGVLKGKIPNRMRSEPMDDYDRLLGIESFYEVLFAMPEKTGEEGMTSLEFTPELVTLRQQFAQFQVFVDYMKRDAWLVQSEGILAQTTAFCEKMLEERDKLVAWLANTGDMKTLPRRSLIGRGAALYLAPEGMFEVSARDKLADDFKRFRAMIQQQSQAFDGATPEESIRIRDRILEEGLPGDPVVRRMWAKKE